MYVYVCMEYAKSNVTSTLINLGVGDVIYILDGLHHPRLDWSYITHTKCTMLASLAPL